MKSFPLGITHANANNSPVHVTVLLSDSNKFVENHCVALVLIL